MLIDIDFFKKVNDDYGHLYGDFVLKEFVHRIRENVLRETDQIGRFGGEEFLLLLPGTNIEQSQKIENRILTYTESEDFLMSGELKAVKITVSIGNSNMEKEKKAKELLKHADVALYQAKNSGRNRSCIFKA